MAKRFNSGLFPVSCPAPNQTFTEIPRKNEEFLLLALLFILLAASPALGIDSSYFFIIIMAIIGMGGMDKFFRA